MFGAREVARSLTIHLHRKPSCQAFSDQSTEYKSSQKKRVSILGLGWVLWGFVSFFVFKLSYMHTGTRRKISTQLNSLLLTINSYKWSMQGNDKLSYI